MSDYCTNCKWLTKQTNAGTTLWICFRDLGRNGITWNLTSLCGNPTKRLRCINENWYEVKVKQQEKKMTTEEMIKVMQAHEAGKQIQSRQRNTNIEFKDDDAPTFNFFCVEYRIKPKYRPLKPEELIELVGAVIVDLDGDQYVVGGSKFYNGEVLVFVFQSWVSSSYLLKNFKHKDGTPVGKMEE